MVVRLAISIDEELDKAITEHIGGGNKSLFFREAAKHHLEIVGSSEYDTAIIKSLIRKLKSNIEEGNKVLKKLILQEKA